MRSTFLSLDGGPGSDDVAIEIFVTGGTGEATYTGVVGESATSFTHEVDLGDFSQTGGFSWETVTSIDFVINANGEQDVDFELDTLYVEVPEPASTMLLMAGVMTLPWIARRRRHGPPMLR